MTFDAFLEQAWTDHSDRPQDVADRLHNALALAETPERLAALARLATHTYGEHLGHWNDGVAFLESLRALPAYAGSPSAAVALTHGICTLRYASGDQAALTPLGIEDRISVLAAAASALAGRQALTEALAAYADAVRAAGDGLPPDSSAHRALAIGGNNLAATLEEKPDRDANETQGMVAAAESALKFWKLAGTWLEEQRAEYRLTRSLLEAGLPTTAAERARRCVSICEQNQAPALERFFAHAVLARALSKIGDMRSFAEARDAALAWFEKVPSDEREWCEPERQALAG